jgi:hypothetical protein
MAPDLVIKGAVVEGRAARLHANQLINQAFEAKDGGLPARSALRQITRNVVGLKDTH